MSPPPMAYAEHALAFACAGETLQGVLALPPDPASAQPTGVVIVVGGPQVRIGSHRQFVLLARRLAAAGHAVLRFDVRGMGDSTGKARSFEDLQPDIAAAIDTLLQAAPAARQVALWGLCDGASASLLYLDATHDPRVAGVCLLNPWVRSTQSLARTQVKHYYRDRLLQKAFWTKLLRGGVGLRALRDLGTNLRGLRARVPQPDQRSFQQRMAGAWHGFAGSVLVLLSENDWTAREFEEHLQHSPDWRGAAQRPQLAWQHIAAADHTLSDAQARTQAERLTLAWLQELRTPR